MRPSSRKTIVRGARRPTSGEKSKKSSRKEKELDVVTSTQQLAASLVVKHRISMDQAFDVLDVIDEFGWKEGTSNPKVGQKLIKLFGQQKAAEVFGHIRKHYASA